MNQLASSNGPLARLDPPRVALRLLLGLLGLGCSQALAQEPRADPWFEGKLPAHIAGVMMPVQEPGNPMSDAKVALGRMLFFDKRLSFRQTTACASCHIAARGFTDGRATPLGIHSQGGTRSTMSVAYSAFAASYTWGKREVTGLEAQLLQPLFGNAPREMDMGGREALLLARLQALPSYQRAFSVAFAQDSAPVNLLNLGKAIAAFQRSLNAFSSAYDTAKAGGKPMTLAAQRGEKLFLSQRLACASCHKPPLFTDNNRALRKGQFKREIGFHNIGLDAHYKAPNNGLESQTGSAEDNGRFKTPSLRNVALSAPYMHDGRFKTLDAVVTHYSTRSSLSPRHPQQSALMDRFELTAQERRDLLSFLRSLTDEGLQGTKPAR